jgi:hypothetical protein
MPTKTCLAAIAAALLIAPLGVAYSADSADTKDKKPEMSKESDVKNLSEWAKEDALKNGVTEKEFDAADRNHNGRLDAAEIEGAGLRTRFGR